MRGFARAIAGAVLAAAFLGACSSNALPTGPLGPCGEDKADATSVGGFPELEVLLPTALGGAAPSVVNSGRSCSDKALGSLVTHGVHELRYAGATWPAGQSDASVVAVLTTPSDQPPLQQGWIEEFYTAGAVASSKTDNVTTTRPIMDLVGQVFRIDALNDLSLQTVVTWSDGSLVHVVIVATRVDPNASRADHDAMVAAAVAIATVAPSASSGPPSASSVP